MFFTYITKRILKNIVGLLLSEMTLFSMTEKWHRREKIYLSILVKKQANELISSHKEKYFQFP